MTGYVAVSTKRHVDERSRVHEVEDGEPACRAANHADTEFDVVPRADVTHLAECRHCSGKAQRTGGQGSELAAKLAAADPDEVSIR